LDGARAREEIRRSFDGTFGETREMTHERRRRSTEVCEASASNAVVAQLMAADLSPADAKRIARDTTDRDRPIACVGSSPIRLRKRR
jgi:hypothetical protein